jgi:hypothetical protein
MKRAWLLAVALLGCAQEEPAAPETGAVGPGTGADSGHEAVLEVDGFELTAAELEPLCGDIHSLYPEYAAVHVTRLALTNEFLPRLALRASAPERWNAARAACAEAVPDALEPVALEGTFQGLGLGLWSAARRLTPGAWSGPIELVGRFVRVRLEEKRAAPDPREESLRLAVLAFPCVDPANERAEVDAAIDRAHLTILDPGFGAAVPEAWKHRMRASKP